MINEDVTAYEGGNRYDDEEEGNEEWGMSTAHISGNFYKYHDLDSEYVERHSSISVADFSVHLHSVECIFNCWNQGNAWNNAGPPL